MTRKLIEKADRLLSKEKGTVFKDPGGRVNVCLIYPNTYHVGMSNLGFQGMYGLLNRMPDVLCERAFLPDDEDMEEYERTGAGLFSLESKRPLSRFDVLAFSVSFENDYPNILKILALSKIPPASARRERPLLIMGGACTFSNPEPLAAFFDVIFLGEAEEALPEFMDILKGKDSKSEILKRASGTEGVYVPSFYEVKEDGGGKISERRARWGAPEKIKTVHVKDISSSVIRHSIITPETEFSDMHLIEAMRGCPWSCSFCLAGHVYNPPRQKTLKAIREETDCALRNTKKVGLIGPSLTDYAHLKDVLVTEGVGFSITSLRANPKAAETLPLMKGKRSISIAPEAGTERLRRAINKKITEEDIIEASRLILEEGVDNLRLYFMVGLPTETDEDTEGLIALVKKIRNASKKGNVVLTLSVFVPKPFTPFQWHPMAGMDEVKKRIKTIKKGLIPVKRVKVFHDVPKYAYMQGLFSMGGRPVSEVLMAMLDEPDWRRASRKAGVEPDFHVLRRKGFDEILPWDFIDSGVEKNALWKKYLEALSLSAG